MPLYESKKKKSGGEISLPITNKRGLEMYYSSPKSSGYTVNGKMVRTMSKEIYIDAQEDSVFTCLFAVNMYKSVEVDYIHFGGYEVMTDSFKNFTIICNNGHIEKIPVDINTIADRGRIILPSNANILLFDIRVKYLSDDAFSMDFDFR